MALARGQDEAGMPFQSIVSLKMVISEPLYCFLLIMRMVIRWRKEWRARNGKTKQRERRTGRAFPTGNNAATHQALYRSSRGAANVVLCRFIHCQVIVVATTNKRGLIDRYCQRWKAKRDSSYSTHSPLPPTQWCSSLHLSVPLLLQQNVS